jgi:hypothetical protein
MNSKLKKGAYRLYPRKKSSRAPKRRTIGAFKSGYAMHPILSLGSVPFGMKFPFQNEF